jgi:penicillin-binding protein 2
MKQPDPKLRIVIFRLTALFVFFGLVVQLWYLQVVQWQKYLLQSDRNRFRLMSIEAPRGIIYDRHGNILVRNKPSFTVTIVPADLPDDEAKQEAVFARLSALLDIPVSRPGQIPSRGVPVAFAALPEFSLQPGIKEMVDQGWGVPFLPVRIATNVERETAFIIEEEHLDLPGVHVQIEPIRQYVSGDVTSHVIGYVGRIPGERAEEYINRGYDPNSDRVGLTGVELTFEDELQGHKGRKHIEVDWAGRETRTVGESEPAEPGHNLILTIDLELQRAMEGALYQGVKAAGSEAGVAIAMNPQTGEILGMVSLPSYDNNLFAEGISVKDYERLSSDPHHPLINHAISGLYPLGSTFKIVPAAAALQEGVVTPEMQFTCEGTLWLPNKYFPDDPEQAQPFYCWIHKWGKHGPVNFISGIAQSCDIYFYIVGGGFREFEGLGLERLADYAYLFGLGERTGIDLPGENAGLVPTRKWKRLTYSEIWVTGDTYNIAIGQGFLLGTPLQILNATAAVANGGTLYRPQIASRVTDAEGRTIRSFAPEVIRELPVSQENLALVREGLRAAVEWGTAMNAHLPWLSVAGKTGTAEYFTDENKDGYPDRDRQGNLPTHAWFTAFAPAENPEIALVVLVEGGGEGSDTAAPIAAQILQHYFPIPSTGIPPEAEATPAPGEQPAPSLPQPIGRHFKAQIAGMDEQEAELSQLVGSVVDAKGQGIPGVRISIDAGGAPIFETVTNPQGWFSYDMLNVSASSHWSVKLIGLPEAEELYLEVEPFKRYTVQFYEVTP